MEFENKVVVVTGGAAGIGKCICDQFQKQGAKVCIIDLQDNPSFVGDIGDPETLYHSGENQDKDLQGAEEILRKCNRKNIRLLSPI